MADEIKRAMGELEASLKQIKKSVPKPIVAAVTRVCCFEKIIKSVPKPIVDAVIRVYWFGSMTDDELEAGLNKIKSFVRKPILGAVNVGLTRVCCVDGMTEQEFDSRLENWVLEPLAVGGVGALFGGVYGVFWDNITKAALSVFKIQKPTQEMFSCFGGFQPLVQSMVAGSGWEVARNFAILSGVSLGIACFMLKLRDTDELEACTVAAFGSGVTLSLVTGLGGNEAISVGVMLALMGRGTYKVIDNLSNVKAKDVSHGKTKDAFSCIGLGIDHHAMNYNTGFFTSNALSLHTDHRKEMKKESRRTWFR